MLVAVVKLVGAQCGVDVVHQGDVGRIVEAGAFGQQAGFAEHAFGVFVTVFGQENLVAFFVDGEITRLDHAFTGAQIELANLLFQLRHHRIDAHIHFGVVFGLAADDQRRAGLVNQN